MKRLISYSVQVTLALCMVLGLSVQAMADNEKSYNRKSLMAG